MILLSNCCPSICAFLVFIMGIFLVFVSERIHANHVMMSKTIRSLHAGDIVTLSLIYNVFYCTLYDLSFPNIQGFPFCHIED